MKEEEREARAVLFLYFNKDQNKVDEWFTKLNVLLDKAWTPRQMIDEGYEENVLRFVKICTTNGNYE